MWFWSKIWKNEDAAKQSTQEEIRLLRWQRDTVQKQFDDSIRLVNDCVRDVSVLNAKIRDRDSVIESMVVDKQKTIESYEDKLASRDAQIVSLETECDRLQGELTALKSAKEPKRRYAWISSLYGD